MTLSLTAQQLPLEDRAIQFARQIPVSKLDAYLPGQPLVQWLNRAAGRGAKIRWEVSDCGEQTGNPEIDRERDFPLCVDAITTLSGGRLAIVSLMLGSFQKGITGLPRLMSVRIGKDNRFDPIGQLRDLPARIKADN